MNGKKKALSLVLAGMMLFVTACGGANKNATGSDGKPVAGGNGGEQYYNSLLDSEPTTLDAQKGSDVYGNKIINNITEPLLRMAEKEDGSN